MRMPVDMVFIPKHSVGKHYIIYLQEVLHYGDTTQKIATHKLE